jgi:5-methylcytosine-specific restriction endonuclease McrA
MKRIIKEKKRDVRNCLSCSKVYFTSLAKIKDHTGFCSKECKSAGPKKNIRKQEKYLNPVERSKRRKLRKLSREEYRKQSKSFLNSEEWKRLRIQVLKDYGNVCLCCGARPPDAIIHVDHIRPRALYPELALDYDNLQPLCKDCNEGKGIEDCTDFRPKKIS